MTDLSYRTGYATDGDSECRLCKSPIPENSLQLAATRLNGPKWFHHGCFFQKHRPKSIGDIADISHLKPDDQEQIRKSVEASIARTVVSGGRVIKRPRSDSSTLYNYGIEYAQSGQEFCAVCRIQILKDEIRIKKVMNNEALWHHVDCFGQIRGDLGFTSSADLLPGFKDLQLEDMKTLLRTLKPVTVFGIPAQKLKKSEGEDSVVEIKEKELVNSQNKQLCQYKNLLSQVTSNDLIKILEYNCQRVPNGQERMMNHLSDCLTFGSLTPCPKCGSQVRFDNRAYICTGQLPLCVYRARDPKRVATRIPLDVEKDYTFLASYSCKVQNRCLPNYQQFADSLLSEKTLEEKDPIDIPRLFRDKPRLHNMEFLVLGIMKRSREEIKKIVVKAGGTIKTNVHDKLAAVIAPKKMVEDDEHETMKMVKKLNIQVVPEKFLDEFMTIDPIEYIETQSICNWGSDPRQRIRLHKGSPYEKSMPKSMTVELKGGSAVDPDSKLQRVAHVYQENNTKYNAVLALTDIQSGRNSFYKLQLLKADSENRFWLFRSWGRIGTSIGDTKVEKFSTLKAAKTSFEREYLDKTGNEWTEADMLVKWPGKYYPLEIDYGKKVNNLSDHCAITSTLDPRVQDLVKLIFNINEMKKVMLAFELDMDKMPLGKLSQQQIKASYGVLNEISDLIGSNESKMRLIEASNRFYTLIPHSFGVSVPPVLNTLDQVCKKMDMLEALLEIELAYNLLTVDFKGETSKIANPVDLHYNQLKTDLVPLEKTDPEYAYLERYATNTGSGYNFEIEAIYKVRRTGEATRYESYKTLHNRRLLWHGSRLTNFVGILSHGLKTGMRCRGLYFADMLVVSAGYAMDGALTHPQTRLILLCEVALGNMEKCRHAVDGKKLPLNKHSKLDMGLVYPNPDESFTREDGVMVPLGRPVTSKTPTAVSAFPNNEYIVYNAAQVNIQYMFKIKFNMIECLDFEVGWV